MNEKIVELYAEAKRSTKEGRMNAPMGVVAEKFAELIVRECADVVSNQYSADWGKWSNTMILEHFGVES